MLRKEKVEPGKTDMKTYARPRKGIGVAAEGRNIPAPGLSLGSQDLTIIPMALVNEVEN